MKNNYLTEEQVDVQENLSNKRLKLLEPKYNWEKYKDTRPTQNLIELMHWVKSSFGNEISSNVNKLNPWIHNKIVIDGSFVEFSEQKKVKITCLYRDSIASWKSDGNNEHFMAQGVFLIEYKGLKFIHAALFHKGNQNEDEVSFFVIIDDNQYNKYISFRNEFDNWMISRDREHLEIQVIGGDGIPYERNMSWDDIFLPTHLKKDIINSVEGFLNAKELYAEKKLPWKRGLLLFGEPGCGKTSSIRTIISNYEFKPVTVQTSIRTNDDTITEAFEYAQEQSPGLIYFEDLDTLLTMNVTLSHFLNLMDGVQSKDGILVIATANDLSKLNEAVVDRPSRFDRKWEIPLPNLEMTKEYLKRQYGKSISARTLNSIAKTAVENNFSYAYLKELYITSAYYALSQNYKDPKNKDIILAMEQLVDDKENVKTGFVTEPTNEIGIY